LAAPYTVVALLSSIAAVPVLHLWRADLRVPFEYDGDSLLFSMIVKSLVDHGWFLTNPNLGAPQGLLMHDYPVSAHDTLHLLVIRGLSLFSHDWALLFNGYYLLGFPLIACSALFALRALGLRTGPAIAASVLYAFLPSRLLKMQGHLFLDTFFQVPLAVLLMFRVCESSPPLAPVRAASASRFRWRIAVADRRSRVALVLALVVSCSSLYYAFFAICLLVAAGVWASFEHRSARNAVSAAVLVAVIGAGLALQALPTWLHQARHGANVEVAGRPSWDAEMYALKVTQLVLPVTGHRVPSLARFKQAYDKAAPLLGESWCTSLGIVGTVGFLVSLLAAFSSREPMPGRPLRAAGVLVVVAVLIGTIAGFGSLIALFVTPQIRTYARLNVFISFLSLFVVVALLDRLWRARPRGAAIVAAAVLLVGLFDQATVRAVPDYAAVKRVYASDRELVRRMENALPAGAGVFELPFSTFPEPPGANRMSGYAPIRPYLHSRTLRWSYPAMRGRSGDAWARDVSRRAPDRMLEALSDAGFGGVLVNRDGYADEGKALEADLRRLLGTPPETSADGHLMFFALGQPRGAAADTSPEAQRRRYLAQHPIGLAWGRGFYDLETEPSRTFRWSQPESELRIENDTTMTRRLSVVMTLGAARPPATLEVTGELLFGTFRPLEDAVHLNRTLEVPPGTHRIRFRCDGPPAIAPNDPRTMIWFVENFAFNELP
jgi:phosphoglycerol transferase